MKLFLNERLLAGNLLELFIWVQKYAYCRPMLRHNLTVSSNQGDDLSLLNSDSEFMYSGVSYDVGKMSMYGRQNELRLQYSLIKCNVKRTFGIDWTTRSLRTKLANSVRT